MLLKNDILLQQKVTNISRSADAFSRPSCSKSSNKVKKVTHSTSTTSRTESINKSDSPAPLKRRVSKEDSGTVSSLECKIDKINSIKSRPKAIRDKGARERKKEKNKGIKKKEEEEKDRGEFKTYEKKMKVSKNHKKENIIKDVVKERRMRYEMAKNEDKNQKDSKVMLANVDGKGLALRSENLVETSRKHELKSETSKFITDKVLDFYIFKFVGCL